MFEFIANNLNRDTETNKFIIVNAVQRKITLIDKDTNDNGKEYLHRRGGAREQEMTFEFSL